MWRKRNDHPDELRAMQRAREILGEDCRCAHTHVSSHQETALDYYENVEDRDSMTIRYIRGVAGLTVIVFSIIGVTFLITHM